MGHRVLRGMAVWAIGLRVLRGVQEEYALLYIWGHVLGKRLQRQQQQRRQQQRRRRRRRQLHQRKQQGRQWQ